MAVRGTDTYSDLARHSENEPLTDAIVFRPEASLLYVNADFVLQCVLERVRVTGASRVPDLPV
jgi:SulP family sulfate permease